MKFRVDHEVNAAVREMSHEVVQRVSEWREKDRQIRARMSDMRQELEHFIRFTEGCAASRLADQEQS